MEYFVIVGYVFLGFLGLLFCVVYWKISKEQGDGRFQRNSFDIIEIPRQIAPDVLGNPDVELNTLWGWQTNGEDAQRKASSHKIGRERGVT